MLLKNIFHFNIKPNKCKICEVVIASFYFNQNVLNANDSTFYWTIV